MKALLGGPEFKNYQKRDFTKLSLFQKIKDVMRPFSSYRHEKNVNLYLIQIIKHFKDHQI